jgi:hypothetical protein
MNVTSSMRKTELFNGSLGTGKPYNVMIGWTVNDQKSNYKTTKL